MDGNQLAIRGRLSADYHRFGLPFSEGTLFDFGIGFGGA
jgi:hypothetical protein